MQPSPIASTTVRVSPSRLARSARKPARKSTKSSFPNSDGWKRKKPMSSQRFEARETVPTSSTSSITPAVPMKIGCLKRR